MNDNDIIGISTQASCVDDDGTIWIFSNDYNALFTYEREKVNYITTFEEEKFFEEQLYNKAYATKNEIYFFPVIAKNIACFSKNTNSVDYIEIPKREKNVYYNIIEKNQNELYLFPVNMGEFAYIFYLGEKTIEKYRIPWEKLGFNSDAHIIGDAYLEGCVYLAVVNTNKILKVDLEKIKYEIISINENVFRTHAYKNTLYALNDLGNAVIEIKEDSSISIIEKFGFDLKKNDKENMKYIDFTFLSSDMMILLPIGEDSVLVRDGKLSKKIFIEDNACQFYDDILVLNKKAYLMPYKSDSILILDLNTHQAIIKKLRLEKREYLYMLEKGEVKSKEDFLKEENVSLKMYCELIAGFYSNESK